MEEKEEKEGGREGEKVLDEEERERGSLFAAMILDRVEADSIQSWTSTNRGAFVVCRYASCSSSYVYCIYIYIYIYICDCPSKK